MGRFANDATGFSRIDGLRNNSQYVVKRKKGIRKVFIVASRNILPGSEILVSYGADYWKHITLKPKKKPAAKKKNFKKAAWFHWWQPGFYNGWFWNNWLFALKQFHFKPYLTYFISCFAFDFSHFETLFLLLRFSLVRMENRAELFSISIKLNTAIILQLDLSLKSVI